MNKIDFSLLYVPDPTKGRPVFNGSIFIGEPNLDPEIPGNQKVVVLREPDGTESPAIQPIKTGAGGVPVYNSSPVQVLTDGDYSIKVLDAFGAQVYYIGNQAALNGLASAIVYNQGDAQAIDRTVESKLQETLSIRDFGAKGDWDGSSGTDDTAAIQAAIDSMPFHPIFVNGVTGGTLRIPPGQYLITSPIKLTKGINLIGDGREASQIVSQSTTGIFYYEDDGSFLPDDIVLRGISVYQSLAHPAVSGAGVLIEAGTGADSISLKVYDCSFTGVYVGVSLRAGIACLLSGVEVSAAETDGFVLVSPVHSTSTVFSNCYAHNCKKDGYFIDRADYTAFIGCASDSNVGYGYNINAADNLQFQGGCELNKAGMLLMTDCYNCNVTIRGVSDESDPDVDGITLVRGGSNTFFNPRLSGPTGVVTSYGFRISSLSQPVTVIGGILTNAWASRGQSQTTSMYWIGKSPGAYFTGGHDGYLQFGAESAPSPTAVFTLAGVTSGVISKGLEVDVEFDYASGSNSSMYVKPRTADTALSYAILIGVTIANAVLGAASTVARAIGLYIAEQTNGSSASANISIAAATPAIGQWSIYNYSTRANLFNGPMQYGQTSAASAPNSSTFVDAADGILKFKDAGGVVHPLY